MYDTTILYTGSRPTGQLQWSYLVQLGQCCGLWETLKYSQRGNEVEV